MPGRKPVVNGRKPPGNGGAEPALIGRRVSHSLDLSPLSCERVGGAWLPLAAIGPFSPIIASVFYGFSVLILRMLSRFVLT